MPEEPVLEAFRLEARGLSQAVEGLSEHEWDLPTRCEPWSVRELLAHIRVATAWLPGLLAAPAPARAEVSAVEYYRPDDRFSPQTNAVRIGLAQDQAAEHANGAALAEDWAATWQQVYGRCRNEPPDRVVRTRHGDAMLLSQFLITRVVEIAVHGLDLADALERDPWLTPESADVVTELLLGPGHVTTVRELGWGRQEFLRKATGRRPLERAEVAQIERLGIRWLTLG